MFADAASLTNGDGEYYLSPEGEFLMADGTKDGHIKATWYIEKFTPAAESDDKRPDSEDKRPESDDRRPESDDRKPESDDRRPSGGDSSNSITSQTAEATAPSATLQANISKESVVTTVINEIKKLFDGLPSSITSLTAFNPATDNKSTKSTPTSLTNTQQAAIDAKSQDVAIIMKPIKVETTGIYVFSVEPEKFSDLEPGWPIFIYMFLEPVEAGTVEISAAEENAAIFINEAGESIDKLPEDKKVNIAAYMEANKDYTPVIATEVSSDDQYAIGASGGGCDSGIGLAGLIALTGLLAAIKRK